MDGLTITGNGTIDGQGSKVLKYNDGGGSLPVVSNYSIRIFIALLEINLCKIYMMNKTKKWDPLRPNLMSICILILM